MSSPSVYIFRNWTLGMRFLGSFSLGSGMAIKKIHSSYWGS